MFNAENNSGFKARRQRFQKYGESVLIAERGEFHDDYVTFCGRLGRDSPKLLQSYYNVLLKTLLNVECWKVTTKLLQIWWISPQISDFSTQRNPVPPGARIEIEMKRARDGWCLQSFEGPHFHLEIKEVALLCPMLIANSTAFSHFLASWKTKPSAKFSKSYCNYTI